MAKRQLLISLLLDEEEEEETVMTIAKLERKDRHELYGDHETEGFQRILIDRHLMADDSLFRKFFRLNIEQFNFLLSLTEENIKSQSCAYVKNPISPAEKLGLTLR